MKKKLTLFLVILFACCSVARAQTSAVSGTVKDDQGLSIPGVTVTLKGTTTAVVTDASG